MAAVWQEELKALGVWSQNKIYQLHARHETLDNRNAMMRNQTHFYVKIYKQ